MPFLSGWQSQAGTLAGAFDKEPLCRLRQDPLVPLDNVSKMNQPAERDGLNFARSLLFTSHAYAFCRLQMDPLDAVETSTKVGMSSKGRTSFCKVPALYTHAQGSAGCRRTHLMQLTLAARLT